MGARARARARVRARARARGGVKGRGRGRARVKGRGGAACGAPAVVCGGEEVRISLYLPISPYISPNLREHRRWSAAGRRGARCESRRREMHSSKAHLARGSGRGRG